MTFTKNRQILVNHQKNEGYFRKLAWALIAGISLYSVYLINKLPNSVSFNKAFIGLAIVWIGIFPGIQYLLDRKRSPIPFFPLVGMYYVTNYGLPIFATNADRDMKFPLSSVTEGALCLAMIGLLGLNIAFFATRFFLLNKITPIKFLKTYSLPKLINVLVVLLTAHLAFLYVPFVKTIPSLDQFLDPIGFVAFGMFLIFWMRGQLSSLPLKIFIGIAFLLEIVSRFASGALAQVMFLGLFIAVIIWYECKKIPIVLIGSILLFFITFNSIKPEFRSLTWDGEYAESSPIEKAQLFINIAIDHYFYSGSNEIAKNTIENSTDSAVDRTATIALFSSVIEDTPKLVSYWNGETYRYLLVSFIPRFIWADKPNNSVGNEFGRRYSYLGEDDFGTSLNLPWIVEMYANFGYLGVLIGMPLVGIFLSIFDLVFNSLKMESLDVALSATILLNLIYEDSNFTVMVGAVIPFILVLYVIFTFFVGSQSNQIKKV